MATLLHVSDHHLGRMTGRVSRAPDHDASFQETVEIARQLRPDLVIDTGDLFDSLRPATEEMHRAIDWLQQMAGLSQMVVVVRGNHESEELFRLFQRLLGEHSKIRFCDRARRPDEGGIVDVPCRDGEQRIRVAPLPFVHANRVISEVGFRSEVWLSAYARRIAELEAMLLAGLRDGYDPGRDSLVLAAHLHVQGGRFGSSERPLHVVDAYACDPLDLPRVDYAGFGHLHQPQPLPGGVPGAFAGSPFSLDFGEAGEQKSCVLVELTPGQPAVISRVPLTRARPLLRVSGSLEELARLGPETHGAILQVSVRSELPVGHLGARVQELFPDCEVAEVLETGGPVPLSPVSAPAEVDRGFPEMLDAYLAQTGAADAAGIRGCFDQLLEAVTEGRPLALPEAEALDRLAGTG